jgi:predicted RNase H-like nuclease (RuvC/YqgF family)
MSRRVAERLGSGAVRYGGTELDHEIRAAYNSVRGAKKALEKTKKRRITLIEGIDLEIAQLETRLEISSKNLNELLEKKKVEEPDTETPGVSRRKKIPPPGMSIEDWHELRKAGKHLEYLNG